MTGSPQAERDSKGIVRSVFGTSDHAHLIKAIGGSIMTTSVLRSVERKISSLYFESSLTIRARGRALISHAPSVMARLSYSGAPTDEDCQDRLLKLNRLRHIDTSVLGCTDRVVMDEIGINGDRIKRDLLSCRPVVVSTRLLNLGRKRLYWMYPSLLFKDTTSDHVQLYRPPARGRCVEVLESIHQRQVNRCLLPVCRKGFQPHDRLDRPAVSVISIARPSRMSVGRFDSSLRFV